MLPVFVQGPEEMPDFELAVVEWVDANSQPGWYPDASAARPLPCRSVGYVVAEDKAAITIAHTINAFGMFGDLFTIPSGCVTSKKVLVRKKGKAR